MPLLKLTLCKYANPRKIELGTQNQNNATIEPHPPSMWSRDTTPKVKLLKQIKHVTYLNANTWLNSTHLNSSRLISTTVVLLLLPLLLINQREVGCCHHWCWCCCTTPHTSQNGNQAGGGGWGGGKLSPGRRNLNRHTTIRHIQLPFPKHSTLLS